MGMSLERPLFDLTRQPTDAVAAFFARIALAAGPAIMAAIALWLDGRKQAGRIETC